MSNQPTTILIKQIYTKDNNIDVREVLIKPVSLIDIIREVHSQSAHLGNHGQMFFSHPSYISPAIGFTKIHIRLSVQF